MGNTVYMYVFNSTIYADQLLNLDDYADVYKIVKTAKSDWKPLGRRLLQILQFELDSIEFNERDDEERLCKMLKFWLTKTGTLSPSQRSLKEALTGIGREDLAARIGTQQG